MPENGNRNQMWERLVFAAVTAALIYFGGAQTAQVQRQQDVEVEDAQNFEDLLRYTMKNCTCEEE